MEYKRISRANLLFKECKLHEIIHQIFENFVDKKNVELHLKNCNIIVKTSEYALHIALENLMSNSIKFSDKNTCKIEISSSVEKNKLIIDYKDNGAGINLNYVDKIFQLFETLGSKSKSNIGIGLAMVL